jgi:hypothetical protein
MKRNFRSDLIKLVNHPELTVAQAVRMFSWMWSNLRPNHGIAVMNEDWDNLLILDACRYDLFASNCDLEGELKSVRSKGTHTGEWMRRNFAGGAYHDTVYVSANPNPSDVDAAFADVYAVWETGWDDEMHTVPPEVMVDQCVSAAKEYPSKRIICHFLQPHYPWIGPEGQEFMTKYGHKPLNEFGHIWNQILFGEIEPGEVWSCYEENLLEVLPCVRELSQKLGGKTVISSDHGNAFGEWGVYGHPAGMYIPSLKRVPWLELPFESRRLIEAADASTKIGREIPEAKLRDLGYI